MKQARNWFWWIAFTIAFAVAVLIGAIVRADRGKAEERLPIAEVYNSGTGELAAYVYAIEKEHRFPNGKVEEGWLMRTVDVPGAMPMWFVKPKKARVEWRK